MNGKEPYPFSRQALAMLTRLTWNSASLPQLPHTGLQAAHTARLTKDLHGQPDKDFLHSCECTGPQNLSFHPSHQCRASPSFPTLSPVPGSSPMPKEGINFTTFLLSSPPLMQRKHILGNVYPSADCPQKPKRAI